MSNHRILFLIAMAMLIAFTGTAAAADIPNPGTITGYFPINSGDTLTIGSGDTLIIEDSGSLIVNGNLTVESGGTLTVESGGSSFGDINNYGTINSSGTINNGGRITNYEAGEINNYGTIFSQTYIKNSGTINNFGSGRISLNVPNSDIDNEAGEINNYGYIGFYSGTQISNYWAGEINNYGTISGGLIVNYATINNYEAGEIKPGSIYNYDGGEINNYGTVNIYSYGRIINYEAGEINNYGTINNGGWIYNYEAGEINNYHCGIFTGTPVEGNPINEITTSIVLDPASATNQVGTSHIVTATVQDSNGNPVAGVEVTFIVTGVNPNDPNDPDSKMMTDDDGIATFTYTGTAAGTDSIEAEAQCYPDCPEYMVISDPVEKKWIPDQNIVELVDIEKEVLNPTTGEWHDADSAPGPEIPVGSTVQWRYKVTNIANMPLLVSSVTDDQGVTLKYEGSNGDEDFYLVPGETWTYTATDTAVLGLNKNVATVTVMIEAPLPGGDIPDWNDEDSCYYTGIENNVGEIPEFPTIALPVMAILGLAFIFQRRRD